MFRPRTNPAQLQHLFETGYLIAQEVLTMYYGGEHFTIQEQIKRPQAVVCIVSYKNTKTVLRLSRSPIYNVANIAASYHDWERLDVPVPEPKLFGTLNEIQYLLMSYVPGKPFTFDLAESVQQKAAVDAGRLLARIRDIHRDGFGYLDATGTGVLSSWSDFLDTHYPLTWIHENGYITHAEADLLQTLKSHTKPPSEQSRLLHGDYKFKNMFIHPDGTISAVTDPQPIAGDPLWDFATFNHFTYREQARQNKPYDDNFFVGLRNDFKEAYETELGRSLQTDELQRIASYEIIGGFGKVEGLLSGKLDETEGESGFMLEYLRRKIIEF